MAACDFNPKESGVRGARREAEVSPFVSDAFPGPSSHCSGGEANASVGLAVSFSVTFG